MRSRLVSLLLGPIVALVVACGSRDWVVAVSSDEGDARGDPGGDACPTIAEPTLVWNTFMGGTGTDYGNALAVGPTGHVYLAGMSSVTWGSPVRPFGTGNWEASIARIDPTGALVWNTFLGAPDTPHDAARGVAVTATSNVIVGGRSEASWDTPVRAYSGDYDAFAASLDADGGLLWNTFLGGAGRDAGEGLVLDGLGNIFVVGYAASWGSPVRPYGGGDADAFVTKLDSNGSLLWLTFLGGTGEDRGLSVVVEETGAIFVAGWSTATWGAPIRPFDAGRDAFVAELTPTGALNWHTFLGGSADDEGRALASDGGGLWLVGVSRAAWGDPLRAYRGGNGDGTVARLSRTGSMIWHTFLGGTGDDIADGLVLRGDQAFVTGFSLNTWGEPLWPFVGGTSDAFVASMTVGGDILWHGFLGSDATGNDYGNGAVVAGDRLFIVGDSEDEWGTPTRPFTTDSHDMYAGAIDLVDVCR